MPKKPSWLWIILFFLYLIAVVSNTVIFFNPESPTYLYYRILLGFNIVFLVPYLLNVLSIIFDILALIPFYNFLNPAKHRVGVDLVSAQAWKWLFAIRFVLIFVGHPYGLKTLQSMLHSDWILSVAVGNILLLFQGPSYISTFIYAYRASSYQKSLT